MDIIQVGLYLLSCLSNPYKHFYSLRKINELSQTYEKGIFYGCRSCRAALFLLLKENG